jgi:hypothetical protein
MTHAWMDDAEIDRLFPFQVVLPAAMYSGHNFRLAIAFSGPSLAPRGHVIMRGNEWLYVFCFWKRDEAETLRARFGGEWFKGGGGAAVDECKPTPTPIGTVATAV